VGYCLSEVASTINPNPSSSSDESISSADSKSSDSLSDYLSSSEDPGLHRAPVKKNHHVVDWNTKFQKLLDMPESLHKYHELACLAKVCFFPAAMDATSSLHGIEIIAKVNFRS
jgi:hypothetical protein